MTTRRDLLRAAAALPIAAPALLDSARADEPRPAGSLLDRDLIYLNHASIGTAPAEVIDLASRLARETERNPWLHVWGGARADEIEQARTDVAAVIGARPDNVARLRTTTEAMNLLAQGLPLEPGDEVLFSNLNHDGASRCFEHWGRRLGYQTRSFALPIERARDLTEAEVIDLHTREIRPNTRVLVLPTIDNTVGMRHPVRAIADAARQNGVDLVLADAAQSVGMEPVDVRTLGVDALATSAHKWLQSPKCHGLAWFTQDVIDRLEPMVVTWGQRRWDGTARALEDWGTHDPTAWPVLAECVRLQSNLAADTERRARLAARVRERASDDPDFALRSPADPALATPISAVEVVGRSSADVFRRLFRDRAPSDRKLVFRAFAEPLNACRISVNTGNTIDQIDTFFRHAPG